MLILDDTDTDGDGFRVRGGEYQIICDYGSTETKLQVLVPDTNPEVWIDTDLKFRNDAIDSIWLSSGATYRMTNGTAGSKCWLVSLRNLDISNRE